MTVMWQEIIANAPAGLAGLACVLLGFVLAWLREQRQARRAKDDSDAMFAKVTEDLLGSSDDQVQRLRADLNSKHLALGEYERQIVKLKQENSRLRERNADLYRDRATYKQLASRQADLLKVVLAENIEHRLRSVGIGKTADPQTNEIETATRVKRPKPDDRPRRTPRADSQ